MWKSSEIEYAQVAELPTRRLQPQNVLQIALIEPERLPGHVTGAPHRIGEAMVAVYGL